MIELLARWCIPDRDNVTSPSVRRAYGTLCGIVGIALNMLGLPREKIRVGNMLPAMFLPMAYLPLSRWLPALL